MRPQVREFDRETAELAKANFIYIHSPFCPFHCSFCGFYTKVSKKDESSYASLIEKEIKLYREYVPKAQQQPYTVIYLGGGTPTQLGAEAIARMLDAVRDNFPMAADAEVTLEGVAEQMLADGFLRDCAKAGVNRLAFGIQSLDPEVRRAIGRGKEDVSAFKTVVERARELDMATNIELMMGCPEQTVESLRRDLEEVTTWEAASIDVTAYVPIPGTNLYRRLVDDRSAVDAEPGEAYGPRLLRMRQLVSEMLLGAGYRAARAECFSKGDHRFTVNCGTSVGNSLHTQLAFGPSAHGHIDGTVYANIADLDLYTRAVNSGALPIERARRLTRPAAERRALLDAVGGMYIPDSLLSDRRRRLIDKWLAKDLIVRSDGDGTPGYAVTERGLHWENQLQLELLGVRDALKGSQLIGSFADQLSFARRDDGMGRELVEQVSGGNPVRRAGYYAGLQVLSRVPGVGNRKAGLLGELDG